MSEFTFQGIIFEPYDIKAFMKSNVINTVAQSIRDLGESAKQADLAMMSPGFLFQLMVAMGDNRTDFHNPARITRLLVSTDPRQNKRGQRLALQAIERQNLVPRNASRRKGLDAPPR